MHQIITFQANFEDSKSALFPISTLKSLARDDVLKVPTKVFFWENNLVLVGDEYYCNLKILDSFSQNHAALWHQGVVRFQSEIPGLPEYYYLTYI